MQIRATHCPCPILHNPRISPCCFISGQRQIWQNNKCGWAFLLYTWNENINFSDLIWPHLTKIALVLTWIRPSSDFGIVMHADLYDFDFKADLRFFIIFGSWVLLNRFSNATTHFLSKSARFSSLSPRILKLTKLSHLLTVMLATLSSCSWQKTVLMTYLCMLVTDMFCCSHVTIHKQCLSTNIGHPFGARLLMLETWLVITISNLSPTHFVTNIRHEHRWTLKQSTFWNNITWTLPVLSPNHQLFEFSHLTLKSKNLFVRRSDFLLLFL